MTPTDRQRAIAQQIQHWHTQAIPHDPLHPHLGQDTKTFDQAFALGRAMEELARPLLEQHFPTARILAHCDTTRASRIGGKRAWLAGREVILPDFEIHAPRSLAFCLDVKSKQYHSYYHLAHDVQQFIDKKPLEDYLAYSESVGIPALLLFHLWPAQAMHAYGCAQEARIHTGYKHTTLPLSTLHSLLQRFPVDDAYYLFNAGHFLAHGRAGLNEGNPGYYLSVRYAFQGDTQGNLPTLAKWQQACQEVLAHV